MKKYLTLITSAIIVIALISWGYIGHKTVATIAESHLTPKAQEAIKILLPNQTIADIASWADEVRGQREYTEYKNTGELHFIDLPLGLSYQQFSDSVKAQGVHNVYGAIMKYERVLRDPSRTNDQKTEALKFIVHLVGDAHQPMHVSRKEDKGGNTIQVQFNGKGTNLHSIWDSGLINREGLTFDQMAKEYDNATPAQIKKWQNESPMQWVWESYQLSTKLYTEVRKNNVLDDEYYKQHIPIVQQRIEMAGIRLAGLLNDIFEHTAIKQVVVMHIDTSNYKASPYYIYVNAKDVANHVGQNVSTSGVVYNGRLIESNNMTLLSIGDAYPNQDFTVLIKGENREKFGQPEVDLKGKTIAVKGKVIDYKGKPEIEIVNPNQLTAINNN